VRTEPVQARLVFNTPVKAIKILDVSGAEIPVQLLELKEESGQWKAEVIFMAKDVPSLGYKTYRVLPAKSKRKI